MNSSSVPASAVQPRAAERASCARRICRGDTRTGLPSSASTSAITSAVPGCQPVTRSVARSGTSTKSPYPLSHEASSYPSTVFISVSTASR